VTREEVTKRASKEFWNLPAQRASSGMFFRIMLTGMIVVVLLLVLLGSKFRARAA
jgi:succinate dehydrogenase hydrophobic anchor subunit